FMLDGRRADLGVLHRNSWPGGDWFIFGEGSYTDLPRPCLAQARRIYGFVPPPKFVLHSQVFYKKFEIDRRESCELPIETILVVHEMSDGVILRYCIPRACASASAPLN